MVSLESMAAEFGEAGGDLERLFALVGAGGVFVLTGAGCSTGSGIPDYRDRLGQWKRAQPIRYLDFVRSEAVRRRYWARSFAGWPAVAAARPNRAHAALAALEQAGCLGQAVTQNVDRLHQRAGQRRVIDLHGRLDWVDCLQCRERLPRERVQEMLAGANPFVGTVAARAHAPDGDAFVAPEICEHLMVPACPACGGVLKPAVVFFGENVPQPRVVRAMERLRAARSLLVVGSSLTVFSGYRFCREAAVLGIPIALVNLGRTRADDLATVRVDGECGAVLAGVALALGMEPCRQGSVVAPTP